jgi:sec-independent protein translocase protein TatC
MTAEMPRQRRPRYRQPDPKYMTFVEHLQELRQRLVKSLAAIAVGSIGGWFLAPWAIHKLEEPVKKAFGITLIGTQVYAGFTLQLKIAIIIGFIFALPITVFQLWGFLAPAFGAKAYRWAPIWIGAFLVLFAAGCVTGYLVVPLALTFFARFQGSDIKIYPIATDYINFIALIMVVFGISFETPLALVSLTSTGVTSSRWLASKRLHAFFACFIFSTIATPGADLVSPLILGGILYILFELGVGVSRLMGH